MTRKSSSRHLKRVALLVSLALVVVGIGLYSLYIGGGLAIFRAQTEEAIPSSPSRTTPQIADITTNATDYPGSKIPQYGKLEITFQISNTVAGNVQFPYDPSPPNGIDPTYPRHQGISVDALFLPPGETGWNNAYQQPAFYYQHFEEQVKKDQDGADQEWVYPTGEFSWKVRFSPNQPGVWHYKIKAQDASGYSETAPLTFEAVDSPSRGFIRVSSTDPRYFEFDDGTPFHGVGFNQGPNLDSPVLKNEPYFQAFHQNNINLLRMWISGVFGAAWSRHIGTRNIYDGYLPRPGIVPFYDPIRNRATLTMRIDYELEGNIGWFGACRIEVWEDPEAVKQNTNYRLRIKYRGMNITGPRNPAFPDYGFVGKTGGWHPDCYEPGTGTVVTEYGRNNPDWGYVEGVWNSGDNNFLPHLYFGLENVMEGQVYVDSFSLREHLGNGQYGPEILTEPSVEYEQYFPQKESFALDKVVELAEQYGIYLKLVLMDKDDKIYYKLEDNGEFVRTEDNLDGFYGVGRTVNKTRWLQQAWWRYLQARWGYSPQIHSWELTNEGDPFNDNHYALTDELGKYMHCRVFGIPVDSGDAKKCTYDHPNDHLVTTSFWHSFPGEQFWGSLKYPNVDYADLHAYISTGWQDNPLHESDAAQFHLDYSADVRSNIDWYTTQNNLPTKPVVRGETGIDTLSQQEEQPDLALDSQGIWLHNFLWSSLDQGGLTELYWWGDNIRNQPGPDGRPGLYEIYGNFYDFIGPVSLNNGHYQEAAVTVSNPYLRVVGQMDLANGRAHLWIQNKQHTWRNVVDGVSIPPIAGTITLSGFEEAQVYTIHWWNTKETDEKKRIYKTESIAAQPNGDIVVTVADLVDDTAIKVSRSTVRD